MLISIKSALDNEDVLYLLNDLHFQCLMDVFLKLYSLEKVCLTKYITGDHTEDEESFDDAIARENISCINKNMSNLLNSRDYTAIIKMLLRLLKNELPVEFEKELSEERKLYLLALVKCLKETVLTLNAEMSDAVRTFDILVEINILFKYHPLSKLKEGLPNLADFDYIYKCIKLTIDKVMEMQPYKVNDFLRYIAQDKTKDRNDSFVQYLVNEMRSKYLNN